ncbi:MAG: dihydrolipoyllysine-residue succinyltransferase [Actinobacteria bacterium]|nr:dihydrolipoyllysine-residue succinyltransferase [Actinomycetota bacterium]
MATEIKMPQLGESVVEGTITKWLKQEGDTIEEDELLVEISTDKVDSEVPSSTAGTLQKILVPEGETVKVGTPIAMVGEAGEAAAEEDGGETEAEEKPAAEAEAEEAPKGQAPAEEAETGEAAVAEAERNQAEAGGTEQAQGDGVQPSGEAEEEAPKTAAKPEGKPSQKPSEAKRPGGKPGDTSKRGIISPLVRRLADEHGVDLDQIDGTGTGGRIRKQDVLKFVESGKGKTQARPAASAEEAPQPEEKPAAEREAAPGRAEPSVTSAGGREELVPWTNIRRRTAEHMVAAHLESARAWNAVEADWTHIVKLRSSVKDAFKQREGFSLTYMPFLARTLCDTLLEMPEVNAAYSEEQQGNIVKHYVNLGIAVALEGGGLIVPVIKGADEKNLVGLARAINDVATRARTKKLSPDDLTGSTFTITNPGPFGSIISVPIIPRGTTAILGFEAIEKRVVVGDDDSIAIRSMGFLSMSWDHRAIDGAEAARFLARLRERIASSDYSAELAQYA